MMHLNLIRGYSASNTEKNAVATEKGHKSDNVPTVIHQVSISPQVVDLTGIMLTYGRGTYKISPPAAPDNSVLCEVTQSCSDFGTESTDHIRFDVPCPSLSAPLPEASKMRLSARVMQRISEVQDKENGAWERDDLRVAWLTVEFAAEGHTEPWRRAFIHYFSGRPEKLIPFWVSREEENKRKLGPTLAEQLNDLDFLSTLPTALYHSQPQTEFSFITEAKKTFRDVMQGKKAA